MKPLTTVLIDTYNHERYIEQALVSVLEQDTASAEVEILVVDDGSTDGTAAIVHKFEPRVRLIRKKNGGQASAFNAGFAEARGEIIAILDGDDWWCKGKLSAVIDILERNPNISAVSHGYYEYDEETKEAKLWAPQNTLSLNLATPDAAREAAKNWRFLLMGALTVRREILKEVVPIPEALTFSADYPISAAAVARGVLVLPQPYSYYRYHSRNLFAVDPADPARMRRRYEMGDTMYSVTWPMLLRLGVPSECVSTLLGFAWVENSRASLHTFSGSRFKTFKTEMLSFRSDVKNPSVAYRLFKYLFVGSATLLLPPRWFYEARSWYSRHNIKRFRDKAIKISSTDA
jgi:glycosyltransferase involved in cell wall biosynthesis